MNGNYRDAERNPGEMVQFAMVFFGFIIGAGGVVTSGMAACIIGLALIGLGLSGFLIRSLLG
jgi:hypothetical protein